MQLKPQDILVLLKLVAKERADWSYNSLAVSLHMSASEIHAVLKRALAARLATPGDDRAHPNVRNLKEFLLHGIQYVFIPERGEMTRGIQYVFIPERGEMTRGMPTGFSAQPISSLFVASSEPPLVWPDPLGEVRGQAFSPLYKSVPKAAREDRKLYELLALVDALRGGNARERHIAASELQKHLDRYGALGESEH